MAMRRGRASPKKSPPEPRGRLVLMVAYRDGEWKVYPRDGSTYWRSFDLKKDAVDYARKQAKKDGNRPSKLVVLNKNGNKSEESRYD